MAESSAAGGSPIGASRPGVARAIGHSSMLVLLAGTLCTFLAMASLWSWRTFASSQGFADVATDMLRDPAVRTVVADQIVSSLEEQDATARIVIPAGPAVEQVVSQLVGTDIFQGLFHASVRELHAGIMQGARSRLLADVDAAADLVMDSLKKANPNLAATIPEGAIEVAVGISAGTPADTIMHVALIAGWLAAPFLVFAIACFAVAVWQAANRRRAVEAVGWCLLGLGLLVEALLHMAGSVASRSGEDQLQGDALRAVFWSTTNLLSIQSAILVTAGAVLVVAGAYAGTGALRTRAASMWQSLWDRLEQPGWKALASLCLITGAVLAMVWPTATAAVFTRVLAFVAFVAGAVGLLDLIGSRHWSFGPLTRSPRAARRWAVGGAGVSIAACALLFFGGLAFIRAVRAPTARHPSLAIQGCNSHPELCGLRLDEVVLAGAHNAFAASREGFFSAHQTGGLQAQLGLGYRAFQLDLHYARKVDQIWRTDLPEENDLKAAMAGLPTEERERLEAALAAGLPQDGERQIRLCHNYCEFGSTSALDAFADMHSFLRENPNEVVILILEDHVAAEDAIEVLEKSRLASLAYAWQPGTALPTLREMIEEGHNVLVLVEHHGGLAPWYVPAYKGALQETGYDFDDMRAFSCAPNRGGNQGALFLLNHWISDGVPSPEVAAQVNSTNVLETRARRCQRERKHLPNILAVDFATRGEVPDIVDRLNNVVDSADYQAAPARPS